MVYRIDRLLDLVFPPRPTERLVRTTRDLPFPNLDNRRTGGCWYLSHYRTPIIQAAIIENKFHNNRRAARWLASGLLRWQEQQSDAVVFVPIPLGRQRQRERGYNQVESVLQANSRGLEFETLLVRHQETVAQSKLSKDERTANVKDAFKCRTERTHGIRNTHLVLLDDVLTTGATMAAARATLAPHVHPSVKITCLALAH